MIIRRNTKEFKALHHVFESMAGTKSRQLGLYALKAGSNLSERIALSSLDKQQQDFLYDIIYDAIRNSFGDTTQRLYRSDENKFLYFFRSALNNTERNPFELKGALRKEFIDYADEAIVIPIKRGTKKELTKDTADKITLPGKTGQKKPSVVKKKPRVAENSNPYTKHPLVLSKLNTVYFPALKLTKKDVFDYYDKASHLILPLLKEHVTYIKWHTGNYKKYKIAGDAKQFKKEAGKLIPSWVETITSKHDQSKQFFLCPSRDHLFFLLEAGCIEIYRSHSKIRHLQYPDFILLQVKASKYNIAAEAALVVHQVLDGLSIPSAVKIAPEGFDVYIPLKGKNSYDKAYECAALITKLILFKGQELIALKENKTQAWIDISTNAIGKYATVPYSVIANEYAGICMPLSWEEMKNGIDPKDYSVLSVTVLLKRKNDPWKAMMKRAVNASVIHAYINKTFGFLIN